MSGALEITRALNGRWHGRYGVAFCPAHPNRRTPALSLADGEGGRLLARCHAGCDFGRVLDGLRALGLAEGVPLGLRPDPEAEARRQAEARADAARRGAQAQRLWDEAVPLAGTPAETYLRGRGITCALPVTLRFHPACWHLSARRLPALVALVEGGEAFGVHRTYLQADGRGKAAVEPAKAMLGAVAGGAVRLTDAPPPSPGEDTSLDASPHALSPLVMAEGLETALSLASGLLSGPAAVWAALSTSGLRALRLPSTPGRLTIAADGDAPGLEAARALASRAQGLGWRVSLLPAPEGRDWNDVLRQGAPGQGALAGGVA